MVIALLGELAVLSNQYQDFGLETPEGGTFKLIKYPESFKTTLMQVSLITLRGGVTKKIKIEENPH